MTIDNKHEDLQKKIQYLEEKIEFLLIHCMELADREISTDIEFGRLELRELNAIKNSRSWRITRPLREMSYFLKRVKKHWAS